MSERATKFCYIGTELELFAQTTNWRNYVSSKLRRYIAGRVIEVGAGPGSSTKYLSDQCHLHWLCIDPDPNHVRYLKALIARQQLPTCCEARCGVLADLDAHEFADTIIYIDVLEHIEDDEGELCVAATHLAPGGHLVMLSPAFNFLYSPFDKAIGHHRRYTPRDAERLTGPSLTLKQIFFWTVSVTLFLPLIA